MLDRKKPLIISSVVLGAALLVSLAIIFAPKLNFTFFKNSDTPKTEQINQDQTAQSFPIALTEPGLGQVFVHYFINGKITALENGNLIVLENSNLPKFQLSPETRVSKLTPPYGSQSSIIVSKNELKPGLNIIISAEYDVRSKEWIVRDVYIPTDKN